MATWKTTSPPRRKMRPVKLRYQGSGGKVRQGDFYWSDTEKAFIECAEGPDTIGLYEADGWKILGWR